jgi:hypothetical protein
MSETSRCWSVEPSIIGGGLAHLLHNGHRVATLTATRAYGMAAALNTPEGSAAFTTVRGAYDAALNADADIDIGLLQGLPREDLVRVLHARVQKVGASAALGPLTDYYLAGGEHLRAPDFVACPNCGSTFERRPNRKDDPAPALCLPCRGKRYRGTL